MKRILIIRGWRSKKEHWEKSKIILKSNGVEVLDPCLPDFEKSEKAKRPWTIDHCRDWFLECTNQKGWGSFNLLGHSFGGAIAAKIAAKEPKRIEKLILAAPAVFGAKSPKNFFFYVCAKTIKPFFLLPPLKGSFSRAKKKLSLYGFKEYYFEEGFAAKTLKNLAKEDFREILENVNVETLIIWGGQDDKVSVKYAKKIKDKIKKSKIIIFPVARHQPYLEAPEEFSKEVINFLNV